MSRKPLFIVEEYLQSSKAEVRQLASQALTVLEDDQSLPRLVQVALEDQNPSVQEEASDLLAGLKGEARKVVRRSLYSVLKGSSESDGGYTERHYRANLLLSRLNPEPNSSELGIESFRQRLRLANGMRDYLSSQVKPSERIRVAWNGVIGGGVGAALFIAGSLALDSSIPDRVCLAIFVISALFGTLMSLALSWRACALASYEDRLAGLIVETVGAISETLFGVTSVTFVTLLAWPQVANASVIRIGGLGIGAIVAGLLYMALIRCGAALGYRAYARSTVLGSKFFKFILRLVVAATGWAFGGVILLSLLIFMAWLPTSYANDDTLALISGFWFTVLPMGIGVALAIAEVETHAVKTFEGSNRKLQFACIVIIVIFLLTHGRVFGDLGDISKSFQAFSTVDSVWLKESIPITQRFKIAFTQKVRWTLETRSPDDLGEISLSVWRGEDEIVRDSTEPLDIEVELKPGFYSAEVKQLAPANTLAGPDLNQRFGKSFRREYFTTARRWIHRVTNRSAYRLESFVLSVAFDIDPGFAFTTAVNAHLLNLDVEEALNLYKDLDLEGSEFEGVAGTLRLLCDFGTLHRLRERLSVAADDRLIITEESASKRDRELLAICLDGDPRTSYGLGIAYFLNGKPQEALAELQAHRNSVGDSAQPVLEKWIEYLQDETTSGLPLLHSELDVELNELLGELNTN